MREYDGNGGCGENGVEREVVMRGGVEKEVVGDCWGWKVWKERVLGWIK